MIIQKKNTEINKAKLQNLIDAVNSKNPGSLYYASCGTKKLWQNKAILKAPTRNWNELMFVK